MITRDGILGDNTICKIRYLLKVESCSFTNRAQKITEKISDKTFKK